MSSCNLLDEIYFVSTQLRLIFPQTMFETYCLYDPMITILFCKRYYYEDKKYFVLGS